MIPRGTNGLELLLAFSAAQNCSPKEQREEDPLQPGVSTTTLHLSFTVKPHCMEGHNLNADEMQHGHPYLYEGGNVQ